MEKRIKRGELIGRDIEVTDSSNPANTGLKGRIIDETKNMLVIKTRKGERKKLVKNSIMFTIKMEGKEFRIKGSEINSAPEERIKLR